MTHLIAEYIRIYKKRLKSTEKNKQVHKCSVGFIKKEIESMNNLQKLCPLRTT